MTVFEVLGAVLAVGVSGWAVLRTTREPRPVAAPPVAVEPETEPDPEPQLELPLEIEPPPPPPLPSTLATLHFSHELRARPARRVSSALALLTITLIAAGGLAALIYQGLTSLGG